MREFYIYLHCKPDLTPFYVGKGSGKRSHDFCGRRNKHHKNIVAKYGAENIDVLVFQRESEIQALADEIQWIKVLRDAGYELVNLTNGGEGTSGYRHTVETRARNSSAHIGNKNSLGRKHSEYAKERMSKAQKIATSKPDRRKKMSSLMKGNKLSLGRKHSLESIAKMTGKIKSDETREKLSMALKGKPNGRLGTHHSAETRAKMSLAAMGNKRWRGAQ